MSDFCGAELTLMKSRNAGESFDEYPVSLISEATISYLSGMTGGEKEFEVERFRPTLLLSGCEPHEEDSWLGKGLLLGGQAPAPAHLARPALRDNDARSSGSRRPGA